MFFMFFTSSVLTVYIKISLALIPSRAFDSHCTLFDYHPLRNQNSYTDPGHARHSSKQKSFKVYPFAQNVESVDMELFARVGHVVGRLPSSWKYCAFLTTTTEVQKRVSDINGCS